MRRLLFLVLFVTASGMQASPGVAQTFVVSGRVVDDTGAGLTNATVVLEGVGFRLTTAEGAFRFESVQIGGYTLRAEALGYRAAERALDVGSDFTLTVTLEIAPIELDSIVVDPESVRVEGRVWDPQKDIPLSGADVLNDQTEATQTSWSGRFRLDAWRSVPLEIAVRAFRYLPFDTLVVPDSDSTYLFEMSVDPLVERMITTEVVRLDERAGGKAAALMPTLHRDELLRWPGATLGEVLRSRFPHRSGYPKCLVLDERSVGPAMIGPTLDNTRAEEVERMAFLFGGGMIRVYTRDFMRTLLGGGRSLREPAYSEFVDPPLCQE